jgi:O-antigen ligase
MQNTLSPGMTANLGAAPRPVLSNANAAGTSLSAAQRIGFGFVIAFVFVVFARIPEILASELGVNLPIAMILSSGAGLTALFGINFDRLRRMPGVLWLLAFTCWLGVSGLFSTWHGGTLEMFKDYWFKSITICLVVALLVITLDQLRKTMYAMAYATFVIVAVGLLRSNTIGGNRLSIGTGSLSNPNEIAGRLLLGFCFCLFFFESEKGISVKRALIGLTIPALLVMALRTGSRSGLLTLAVLAVMLLLRATTSQKAMLLVAAGLMAVVAVVFLPRDVVDRYLVMFTSRDDLATESVTSDQLTAVLSREQRSALAQEALGITLSHPLFGVGPGVYAAAAAEVAKSEGRRAMWHETHDTLLQISAEAGIPALILYLFAIGASFFKTYSLYRITRNRPETQQIHKICFCLMLAISSWFVGALFDSQAYRLEFPLMTGLICAFILAAERELARLSPARSMAFQPFSPALAIQKASAAPPAIPSVSQPLPPAKNPFRFGRMRNR